MSPVHRVVRTIRLNDNERIDIVRQDGNDEVILAIVESHQNIQKRTAVYLTLRQANKLARDMAGISVMVGVQEEEDGID
jgi:hypothetical protein